MPHPKCKYCKETVLRKEAIKIKEISINGIVKNLYLHENCLDDYNDLMEYKKQEIMWFNEIINYLKELLNYTDEQELPNGLITRIQDLRNGTVLKMGVGRVVKSKEGYPYDIILDTLLIHADSIRWFLANKNFENEKKKINYLMAIIDSNINDTYIKSKNKISSDNIKKRNNIILDEKESIISQTSTNIIKPKKEGISKFLNDDEF